MQIFKNRFFTKWAREIGLTDETLNKAVKEISDGLYEANLGGNIYKKRVAIAHKGKRSGARTILAFKENNKAIFVYGFSKNKLANITIKDEDALKDLAKLYFSYTETQINHAVKMKELFEVHYE